MHIQGPSTCDLCSEGPCAWFIYCCCHLDILNFWTWGPEFLTGFHTLCRSSCADGWPHLRTTKSECACKRDPHSMSKGPKIEETKKRYQAFLRHMYEFYFSLPPPLITKGFMYVAFIYRQSRCFVELPINILALSQVSPSWDKGWATFSVQKLINRTKTEE